MFSKITSFGDQGKVKKTRKNRDPGGGGGLVSKMRTFKYLMHCTKSSSIVFIPPPTCYSERRQRVAFGVLSSKPCQLVLDFMSELLGVGTHQRNVFECTWLKKVCELQLS